ncbi:hypothetical protein LCGC14_0891720 [marine sediment metagenome]|uniref:Uncharacterized protein n=1 Tax=marine sediment metagenome TaxID=412755 RepID=A0A0F9RIC4_9ZZZZ
MPAAGVNTTAEKRQTEDGHWGVYVDTEHTTTYPDKDKLVYEVEKKIIPGYSIEYTPTDFHNINLNGKEYRFIEDIDFNSYGFANGRKMANPKAEIMASGYKEMVDSFKKIEPKPMEQKEIDTFVNSLNLNTKEKDIVGTALSSNEIIIDKMEGGFLITNWRKDIKLIVTTEKDLISKIKEIIKLDKETKEVINMKKEIKEDAPKEQAKPAEKAPTEEKKDAPKEDTKETKEVEDKKVKEFKEFQDFTERKEGEEEKIKKEVKELKEKKKPMLPDKAKIEGKELEIKQNISYKEAVFGNKEGKTASLATQWKEAARLHNALDMKGLIKPNTTRVGGTSTPFEVKEINGTQKIQYKTLTTDSNVVGAQTTYWDALDNYEQTPAELNDIYGPVIISQLNEMTTTFNLLSKIDMSGASAIRFRVKTARPTADGSVAYGSTPSWDSRAERQKINVAFVTYRQDIAVEFEEIELAKAPGGIGDVYAEEIKDGTESMMNTINSDILTSSTTPTESEPYTFENTIITSGSLYGKPTATYTQLRAASVTNASSAPLTLERMRTMIDDVKARGAGTDELVFICHYTQSRKFKTLIQNIQRTVPTSARVGFEGRPELDGVPVFEDFQANTDDLWLISTKHTKVAIKKAPTYIEFGLTQMRRQGVIWTMMNLFSTKPGHNAWTYALKTT